MKRVIAVFALCLATSALFAVESKDKNTTKSKDKDTTKTACLSSSWIPAAEDADTTGPKDGDKGTTGPKDGEKKPEEKK